MSLRFSEPKRCVCGSHTGPDKRVLPGEVDRDSFANGAAAPLVNPAGGMSPVSSHSCGESAPFTPPPRKIPATQSHTFSSTIVEVKVCDSSADRFRRKSKNTAAPFTRNGAQPMKSGPTQRSALHIGTKGWRRTRERLFFRQSAKRGVKSIGHEIAACEGGGARIRWTLV
jgi:hypothetical protein